MISNYEISNWEDDIHTKSCACESCEYAYYNAEENAYRDLVIESIFKFDETTGEVN